MPRCRHKQEGMKMLDKTSKQKAFQQRSSSFEASERDTILRKYHDAYTYKSFTKKLL